MRLCVPKISSGSLHPALNQNSHLGLRIGLSISRPQVLVFRSVLPACSVLRGVFLPRELLLTLPGAKFRVEEGTENRGTAA